MVVAGTRSPWVRTCTAIAIALVVILLSYVSFGEPKKDISAIKDATVGAAVDKVCKSGTDDGPYNFKTRYPLKEKPNKKVVALLFVGRKHYVEILDCYIRRNLVKNGGWLDEAVWIIHTTKQSDVDFLEQTVKDVPEYSQHIVENYGTAYKILQRDTTYVKIDDDVVFMEDHTIPAIVKRLNDNPQFSIVSANVMNQPALSWVHYHLGAHHPYLPEPQKPEDFIEDRTSIDDWRLSSLPYWQGPKDFEFNASSPPTFQGHRWLRLPDPVLVEETPIGVLGNAGKEYHASSQGLKSWAIAAQEHYSFLENLEHNQLWRYKFDVWHYHFERLSVNFIAFDGDTLLDHPIPDKDDEKYLTLTMPKNISRPAVLDGTGMAVHFGFGPQTKALNTTDLLLRYKNYAEEFVCGKPIGSPRL